MLVRESRILQVAIFGTLKDHLYRLDFSLWLPDVMTIADKVEAQLTQSIDSRMGAMKSHAAWVVGRPKAQRGGESPILPPGGPTGRLGLPTIVVEQKCSD